MRSQRRTALGALLLRLLLLSPQLLPDCDASDVIGARCRGGDGPGAEDQDEHVRGAAERALADYAALHRRILDPRDTGVEKRFLVLQPLLGMGNSQIEEVTALLIAMQTRRAFVVDLFDRSVGDREPAGAWYAPHTDVYAHPINLDKRQLMPFMGPRGGQV